MYKRQSLLECWWQDTLYQKYTSKNKMMNSRFFQDLIELNLEVGLFGLSSLPLMWNREIEEGVAKPN